MGTRAFPYEGVLHHCTLLAFYGNRQRTHFAVYVYIYMHLYIVCTYFNRHLSPCIFSMFLCSTFRLFFDTLQAVCVPVLKCHAGLL